MIEMLGGFPDDVVAAAAKGRVTRLDYDQVLIPRMDEAFVKHERVRCYYELGPQFSGFDAGAAWEDFRLGLEHLRHWERVAIVTDVEWIRLAMGLFHFLLPGRMKVFPTGERDEARRWVCAS